MPIAGGMLEAKQTTTRPIVVDNVPVNNTDGTPAVTTEVAEIKYQQPSNPKTDSRVTIDAQSGKVDLTFPSVNIPEEEAPPTPVESSLGYMIYLAGALAVGGIFMAIFVSVKYGVIATVAGVLMMSFIAGLSTAMYEIGLILAGVVVVIVVLCGILGYRWYKDRRTLTQTATAINKLKLSSKDAWQELKPILNEEQDHDVKANIVQNFNK